MALVEKSIVINAPVEEVFQFIANQPERMPDWWGPMEEQERVTPAPTKIGSVSRYVYSMMGFKIKGEHEVKAYDENSRLLIKTTSGIDSTFDFRFAPAGDGTELSVIVEYTLPGGAIGRLGEQAVLSKNEKDWEKGLAKLKEIMESGS